MACLTCQELNMSYEQGPSASNNSCCNSVPGWIASGIVGLALGAGATLLGIETFGPVPNPNVAATPTSPAGMPGMGGGAPGMGGGGMMGGGGGGKRALTSLVGKLELLSRPNLKLQVELEADQVNAIAAKLLELEKADAMTGDQAQEQLDAFEALLTSEQKDVLAMIGLPFGRGGGNSGGGRASAGGSSAGGGTPTAGAPLGVGMMGMGGGGNPNENPFAQEVNQKRLKDLLARLVPSAASDVVEKSQ